jgi:hypothetical protein
MAAEEPTDDELLEFALSLLGQTPEGTLHSHENIAEAVREARHLWLLLYGVHHRGD